MSVSYKYGTFTTDQMKAGKKQLHAKIHWLLLYKDPKTEEQYQGVDLDQYFETVMSYVGGMDELFGHPSQFVMLQSILQAAQNELHKDQFNWRMYRQLVLKAHKLVDEIPTSDEQSGEEKANV